MKWCFRDDSQSGCTRVRVTRRWKVAVSSFRYLSIYQEATDIYGLIHARFIITPKGLAMMRDKYQKGVFGVCPRVLCERQHLLPIGMSEELRTSRVKVFCPRCEEVYVPKKKYPDVDGAYFGCSFPNILLMVLLKLLRCTRTWCLNQRRYNSFLVFMVSRFTVSEVLNMRRSWLRSK